MALYAQTGSLQTYGAVEATGAGVLVPDVQLLFTGDYSRAGSDLVLTGSDGAKFLVTGYFNTDTPPSLISPEGAKLPGDVVMSLAGLQFPGQYAQAEDATSGKQAIGKVESASGSASAVRTDGTTQILKAGDPVFQGDVVLTGPGSKLGISFVDNTIFSLSANARMVLNSLVFDPDAGQNNSMLFSLVEGSFVFAAGQIAPTGDMKIQTPVATMGIRGTAPTVNIDSETGEVNFSIIADPGDGHVGSYTLYNLDNGLPIGTVSSVGTKWQLKSATGQIVELEKTEADLLNDANAVGQINTIYSQWQNSTQQNPDGPQAGPENNSPPSGGLNTNPQNPDAPGGDGGTGGQGGEGQGEGQNNDQSNNRQSTAPPPPATDTDDIPPPPPPPPEASGPNFITGTDNTDVLNATPGVDEFNARGGDDFIIIGAGEEGENGDSDDVFDGGEGNDTIDYSSTSQGIEIDLVNGFVTGVEINTDTITNINNFVAGSGNDTIKFTEDSGFFFDGGDGVDTLQIVGGLNIDSDDAQLEAENVEILDLNNTDENILTITASDINEANDDNTLQIRGGTNADGTTDTVNLTSDFYIEGDDIEDGGQFIIGSWRLVGTDETDGITFDVYEFRSNNGEGGEPLATALIEQGINVTVGQTIVRSNDEFEGSANVGYYDTTDGQGDSSQAAPILAAGHNPINITTPNAAALQDLNVLFLQVESNSSYGAEFLNNLAAIHEAVAAGMTLIIHDRFVSNAESILPGSEGFNIVRNFSDGRNIDVLDPDSTVADGPGGKINDSTLDGGNFSNHGFGVEGTLPEDAELILSTGNDSNIVTFSYPFGDGNVIYSTIPLDFYLDGSGAQQLSSNFSDIYAPNVVEYATELNQEADQTLIGGTGEDIIIGNQFKNILIGNKGNDTIIGNGGNDTLTSGPGSDEFVFNSLNDGIDTITDFSPLDSLDLSGLLAEALGPVEDIGAVINEYIQAITDSDGNTTIAVDIDGPDGPEQSTDIAVLQGIGSGISINVSIGDEDTSVTSGAIVV